MKKIYFFSSLKVALIIVVFNVSTSLFANTNIKFNLEFNKQIDKGQCLLSNNTTYFKGESRLEYTVVLSYNLKKSNKINFFRINPFLEINEKTNKLYYYSEQIIIPSLRSTSLIYPFHSFL